MPDVLDFEEVQQQQEQAAGVRPIETPSRAGGEASRRFVVQVSGGRRLTITRGVVSVGSDVQVIAGAWRLPVEPLAASEPSINRIVIRSGATGGAAVCEPVESEIAHLKAEIRQIAETMTARTSRLVERIKESRRKRVDR